MGLFGASKGGGFNLGGFFDRLGQGAVGAQAALAGDYGALAQINSQRARQRQAEAEAEEERRLRQIAMESAEQLGIPKAALNTMRTEELSRLVFEMQQPRQFGSEGGSIMTPGAPGEAPTWQNAPRSYTDEGRVFQIGPDGTPRQVMDARENDVDWQTGPWGAFATDRAGRPVAPGTNIQSPMGQTPQPPGPQLQAPPAQPQPGIAPTSALDPASVFGRMIQQESRGQQFGANGRPLRSPAGAIGIAQVMPATGPEAAALAGLPWDPRRLREDAQYNAALGSAYFQKQLQDFGDPVLAAAAYNAGPNRIRNALRRGGANWQAHIPQETRDYVRTVFGGAASGTQTAQAGAPNIPGQGRSIQDQAAGGFVQAPQQAPPGMRWTPQGGLEPIQGGEQDYGRQHQTQQAIGQVVQQYRSDPVVREWQQARTSTMQLQRLGETGRPADDVAIIFQFMKALDPTSAVRENEVALAQQTSLPDRIRNYYNEAVRGNLLGPQQRRDLIATAGRLYTERSRNYNEHVRSYQQQLQSMGVEDPADFVPIAMAPITEDRRRRERQQNFDPQQAVDAAQSAVNQMLPGTAQRIRITGRRRRR